MPEPAKVTPAAMSVPPRTSIRPSLVMVRPAKVSTLSWPTTITAFWSALLKVKLPALPMPSASESMVSPPPLAETRIWPSKLVLPLARKVALSGEVEGSPPVTVRTVLITDAPENAWNTASTASRVTGWPVSSPPSRIDTPATPATGPGVGCDTVAVPALITALSPGTGTCPVVQLAGVNQLPILPEIHV